MGSDTQLQSGDLSEGFVQGEFSGIDFLQGNVWQGILWENVWGDFAGEISKIFVISVPLMNTEMQNID